MKKPSPPPAGRTQSMAACGRFVDRNLVPVKSAAQQNSFAPTPAAPVRMHYKLAGGA